MPPLNITPSDNTDSTLLDIIENDNDVLRDEIQIEQQKQDHLRPQLERLFRANKIPYDPHNMDTNMENLKSKIQLMEKTKKTLDIYVDHHVTAELEQLDELGQLDDSKKGEQDLDVLLEQLRKDYEETNNELEMRKLSATTE